MSDLTSENISNLRQYHSALRQFLAVSPAPTKSNPSRAAKAREKLLKLSASQFLELSTDVYDELQRRISESQEEPNFLLPMANFHPKRNEAREKLGSLQQTRFRDLVSDIFYEIERRNQNIINATSEDRSSKEGLSKGSASNTVLKDVGDDNQALQGMDAIDGKKQGVVTLQSSTVIPTKADMAWSSDEEEDVAHQGLLKSPSTEPPEKLQIKSPQSVTRTAASLVSSASPFTSSNRTSTTSPTTFRQVPSVVSNESPKIVTNKTQSNQSPSNERDTITALNEYSPTEPRIQRGMSLTKNRNKDRDIELLIQEGTKMDHKITDLEQMNSLLLSKSERYEEEVKTLQTIKDNLSDRIRKLESENKTLQSELAKRDRIVETLESSLKGSREVSSKTLPTQNKPALDVDETTWKTKYQEIKDFHTRNTPSLDNISSNNLQRLLSPSGSIPIAFVEQLRGEIQGYILLLIEGSELHGLNTAGLFEHMNRITDVTGNIISCSPHTPKAEFIRAAVSHALTTTRYYCVYSELLPRLVVESAVCQIAFTVFELIQDVKLRNDAVSTATTPASSVIQYPKSSIEDRAGDDVSPVRPLRMAKKSESSQSIPRSVSTTATPKPLNLTINSQLANSAEKKPSSLLNRESPLSSKAPALNGETKTPTKLTNVASRYSPENNTKAVADPPFTNGLRKSSSTNILSRVKQFEEQADVTPKTSPKKAVVSPLSDNVVGVFGKRKVSESGATNRSAAADESSPPKTKPLGASLVTSSHTAAGVIESPVSQNSVNGRDDAPIATSSSPDVSPVKPLNSGFKSTTKVIGGSLDGEIDELQKDRSPVASDESKTAIKSKEAETDAPSATTEKQEKDEALAKPLSKETVHSVVKTPTKNGEEEESTPTSHGERQVDEDDFDVDEFDIEDPDNTLSELLLYLEHQTVKVISTIQALLTAIKTADSTKGELRSGSKAISDVVSQMVEATSNSMNQSRNAQLREHGRWVVDSLADSKRRMNILCTKSVAEGDGDEDEEYADKQFKQRLAGIAFDVAKCTKELVKTVEEANLKEEIEHLNARLVR